MTLLTKRYLNWGELAIDYDQADNYNMNLSKYYSDALANPIPYEGSTSTLIKYLTRWRIYNHEYYRTGKKIIGEGLLRQKSRVPYDWFYIT